MNTGEHFYGRTKLEEACDMLSLRGRIQSNLICFFLLLCTLHITYN